MKVFDYQAFRNIPIPKEEEIVASWTNQYTKPLVSVLCTNFNQKSYLMDALRGFLIQKTSFPFEIIIHDDASTDGSIELQRDYAARYPRLIKLITQTENQYSQGRQILPITVQHAKGDFFAVCEADDFWIDSQKLQRQVMAMQRDPQFNISFHLCFMGNTDNGTQIFHQTAKTNLLYPSKPCVYTNEMLVQAGGGVMPTASLLIRRECLESMPEWFDECPVGDYFIEVLAAEPAGALFLPYAMNFYRVAAKGSWTESLLESDEKKLEYWSLMTHSLGILNLHLDKKYQTEIKEYWTECTMQLLADNLVFRTQGPPFFQKAKTITNWPISVAMFFLAKSHRLAKVYAKLGYQLMRVRRLFKLWFSAKLADFRPPR